MKNISQIKLSLSNLYYNPAMSALQTTLDSYNMFVHIYILDSLIRFAVCDCISVGVSHLTVFRVPHAMPMWMCGAIRAISCIAFFS